ncbi:hypothetical protein EVAR_65575_1 [Eumeta japonica]|uniref:Uncharacterized protein n=1 Tax=Eumeta variegata TaxID=151549 RepID=A0A4C1Z352_EUMVA|nr:hypothetical protein EVAR_65575_1 [Eumeta japonica]
MNAKEDYRLASCAVHVTVTGANYCHNRFVDEIGCGRKGPVVLGSPAVVLGPSSERGRARARARARQCSPVPVVSAVVAVMVLWQGQARRRAASARAPRRPPAQAPSAHTLLDALLPRKTERSKVNTNKQGVVATLLRSGLSLPACRRLLPVD